MDVQAPLVEEDLEQVAVVVVVVVAVVVVKYLLVFTLLISPQFASTKKHNISINGMERSYYLHLPTSHINNTTPLVIYLHGGGQNIKEMARSSLLNKLSNEHGFIVVYPLGVDKHWKDGRGVTYGDKSKKDVDDVAFIKELIDTLIKTYKTHVKKVYITGVSNGGIMTQRLACELSHKISAIAPVISNLPRPYIKHCKPSKPLSVLLMNGTKDPIVPWYGGKMKFFGKTMGNVVSTEQSLAFWKKHNVCTNSVNTKHLANINKHDKTTVTVTEYDTCHKNTSVQLYTIQGGGHTMPSKKDFNMPLLVGEKNRDIEGMQVIVDFLLKH